MDCRAVRMPGGPGGPALPQASDQQARFAKIRAGRWSRTDPGPGEGLRFQ